MNLHTHKSLLGDIFGTPKLEEKVQKLGQNLHESGYYISTGLYKVHFEFWQSSTYMTVIWAIYRL